MAAGQIRLVKTPLLAAFLEQIIDSVRKLSEYLPVMKTTTTKQGRVWNWEVTENGEVIAGGTCKTKTDAAKDAAIWIETTESNRARKDGRIAKGELLTIKPEWMDKGDENYNFYAFETQLPGMTDIRMYAHNKGTGEISIGLQTIQLNMIIR